MKTISNILVHISKIPKIFHPKCLDNKTHGEKLIYACRLLVGTRWNTMVQPFSNPLSSQVVKGGTDEKLD